RPGGAICQAGKDPGRQADGRGDDAHLLFPPDSSRGDGGAHLLEAGGRCRAGGHRAGERCGGLPQARPARSGPAFRGAEGIGKQGRRPGEPPLRVSYLPLKSKFAVTVWFGPTVISWSCVPSFSCHASSVYLPGGRFLIEKVPSSPLVAKKGCGST